MNMDRVVTGQIASGKDKPTAKSNRTVRLLIQASSNDPSLHGLLLKRSDDESKRASLINAIAMVQPARTSGEEYFLRTYPSASHQVPNPPEVFPNPHERRWLCT